VCQSENDDVWGGTGKILGGGGTALEPALLARLPEAQGGLHMSAFAIHTNNSAN
jgi:hypothetical protein